MRTLLTVGCLLATLAAAPLAQSQTRGLLGDDLDLLAIAIEDDVLRYDFEIGGEARTVSYEAPRRGVALVRVTDKSGRELVAVRAARRGRTVRVDGEVVRLREGQSLYEVEGVDLEAAWLVNQNYAASRCIGLDWLETVVTSVTEANDGETTAGTRGLLDIAGIISDIIGGGETEESCTETYAFCTEEDFWGNTEEVNFECACGLAVCTQQRITVAVPYVYIQDGELRTNTNYVTTTRCLCGCLVPPGNL